MGTISYHVFEKNDQIAKKIESVLSEYEEVINLGVSSTYDDMMNCALKKMPKVIFF